MYSDAVTNPAPTRNSSGLTRDIRLIELLASDAAVAAGGLGVNQLALRTGRSKSVVSRALASLAEAGLVSRDPNTLAYSIGSKFYAIAARGAEARLVHLAKPVLVGLVRSTQETAHLCVLSHGNELTLASEISPHKLRSAGWQGVTTAAWRTSSGRVLISEWGDKTIRSWYDAHRGEQTVIEPELVNRESNPFTLLDASHPHVATFEGFMSEIRRIRRQGYAVLNEEFEAGVIAVSAPVRDADRRIIAAVNVSGPTMRIGERIEPLALIVRQAAVALSTIVSGADTLD